MYCINNYLHFFDIFWKYIIIETQSSSMRTITALFLLLLVGVALVVPIRVKSVNDEIVWVYEVKQPIAFHSTAAQTPRVHVWRMTDHVVSSQFAVKSNRQLMTQSFRGCLKTCSGRICRSFFWQKNYFYYNNYIEVCVALVEAKKTCTSLMIVWRFL